MLNFNLSEGPANGYRESPETDIWASGQVSLPPPNGMPPKVSMPVVNQITRSPGLLNFNRFSPHTFHLDKKIEVFAAEGSLNHESPGQLKFPGSVLKIISSPLKTKLISDFYLEDVNGALWCIY